MSLLPNAGINYFGLLSRQTADMAFLSKINTKNVRGHIPGSTGYALYRSQIKMFTDAGYWTSYGSTQGVITSSNWQQYHDDVVTEATYCQANGVCTEFEVGNELDQSIIFGVNKIVQVGGVATATMTRSSSFIVGETVTIVNAQPSGFSGAVTVTGVPTGNTFTYTVDSALPAIADLSIGVYCFSLFYGDLYTLLQQLCLDVKAVFSGAVTYAISAQYPNVYTSWTSGVGNFDKVSVHPYGIINAGTHAISFTNTTNILNFANTYFGNKWYISEFNLDSNFSRLNVLTPSESVTGMSNMLSLINAATTDRTLLYTFVGSSNSDNQFAQIYSDNGTNPMWYTFFQSQPTQYARTRGASTKRGTSVTRPASVTRTTYPDRPLFNNS